MITKTQVIDFIDKAKEVGSFSFDVEYDAKLSYYKPRFKMDGCSFATENMSFYARDYKPIKYICNKLFPTDVEAIAHNLKHDIQVLKAVDLIVDYPENPVDTMIGVNLLDDNRRPNELGLKVIMFDFFDHKMMTFKEAAADGLHTKKFEAYTVDDAESEYRLWKHIRPLIHQEGLDKVFYKILMAATKVFADIELHGIRWDWKKAKTLLVGFQELRDKLEVEIYNEIGFLNLNSGDQLANRLFRDMKYSSKGVPMTKSAKRLSVDEKAMAALAEKYPVCKKIVKYRTSNKMINTYVEPLTRQAISDPKNRIHSTFWLVSSTGRTRNEKPNLQNIPAWLDKEFKHLNIRSCFIPEEGKTFIVADLSQIELRLCGHISGDEKFLTAYNNWRCTACGKAGSDTIIKHNCPSCGAAETEAILTRCPNKKCKKEAVSVIKAKNGDPLGCAVCLRGENYDEIRIKGFFHGEDLHQKTTDLVPALHGDRQNGKRANFALIYLATARKMNLEYPDLSVNEWQQVIDGYFYVYRGVKKWHRIMERLMWERRVCVDVFGRKRRLLKSEIERSPKHALNQFVNFPIQSSACAYIELCMFRLWKFWKEKGVWNILIRIVNMVHDELVFEVDPSYVETAQKEIAHVLENSVRFKVSIRTGLKLVDNWAKG